MPSAHGSALVLGILRASDDGEQLLQLGAGARQAASSWYAKDHLVPFAEFFPVPSFVRYWLRLMNLPYSDFTRGAARVSRRCRGRGPAARRRASATRMRYGSYLLHELAERRCAGECHQRCLVRTLHGPLSAFPDRPHACARGRPLPGACGKRWRLGSHRCRTAKSLARAPEYQAYVLRSAVAPAAGLTPYARVGNWLIISLAAATLALSAGWAWSRRRSSGPPSAAHPIAAGYSGCWPIPWRGTSSGTGASTASIRSLLMPEWDMSFQGRPAGRVACASRPLRSPPAPAARARKRQLSRRRRPRAPPSPQAPRLPWCRCRTSPARRAIRARSGQRRGG